MGPRGLRSLWYHVQVNSAPYAPTTESRGRARLSLGAISASLSGRYEALVERNIHEDGMPVKLGGVGAPVIPPRASLWVVVPAARGCGQ